MESENVINIFLKKIIFLFFSIFIIKILSIKKSKILIYIYIWIILDFE